MDHASLSGANYSCRPFPNASISFLQGMLTFRASYLGKTLASLSELPGLEKMAVYISQDGNVSSVHMLAESVIAISLQAKVKTTEHWHHDRVPLISETQVALLRPLIFQLET